MGEMREKFWSVNLKGMKHLEDQEIEGSRQHKSRSSCRPSD